MLYINSPGGMVTAGWRSTTPCSTCAPTWPPSAWARRPRWAPFLLAAGAKGKRYSLPHARILIHQPLGGFQGQATDIDIHARRSCGRATQLNELLVKHTGQPLERIKHDTERDYFMSAMEAKEYGLIDDVLIQKPRRHRQVRADRVDGAGLCPARVPAKVFLRGGGLQSFAGGDGNPPRVPVVRRWSNTWCSGS